WQMLVFLAAIAFLVWVSWARKEGHVFDGECFKCHLSLSGPKTVFVKDIDILCKDCHRDLGLSHPSNMKPSMSMPRGFPLDWMGRMTCATCHDVHGKGDFLLRGGNRAGRVLCFLCHKESLGKHAGSDQPAHSGRGFEVMDAKSPIDRLSIECLSCHDSSLAKMGSIGMGTWSHGTGTGHPIGVDYMKAFIKGGYKHPSTINKAIRLFSGKVGCGSCHNMYSKEKYNLSISNKGSALCLACHIK
ncbi:MAG: hypothetical protein HZC12_09670, partial [Nitrospirae bacterium]|nr:hypothetical protein [Nitrospirota bacterium]